MYMYERKLIVNYRTCKLMYMYTMYSYANVHIQMKVSWKQYIHEFYVHVHTCNVPSMLANDVETINKQTQQTSSHPGLEK